MGDSIRGEKDFIFNRAYLEDEGHERGTQPMLSQHFSTIVAESRVLKGATFSLWTRYNIDLLDVNIGRLIPLFSLSYSPHAVGEVQWRNAVGFARIKRWRLWKGGDPEVVRHVHDLRERATTTPPPGPGRFCFAGEVRNSKGRPDAKFSSPSPPASVPPNHRYYLGLDGPARTWVKMCGEEWACVELERVDPKA